MRGRSALSPSRTAERTRTAAQHWSDRERRHHGLLRAWDVAAGTARDCPAVLPDPFSLKLKRPGVVAWDGFGVAFAWGDGKLRFWKGNDAVDERDGFALGITLLPLPDKGGIVAGRLSDAAGYLEPLQLPALQPIAGGPYPGAAAAETAYIPLAAALVHKGSLAATLVYTEKMRQGRIRLQLMNADPRSGQAGKLVRDLEVWPYDERLPVVAADSGGQFLAVAGNEGDRIQVYSVPDLLGKGGTPASLRSLGTIFRFAAPVRSAKGRGLVLHDTRAGPRPSGEKLQEDDLVFDFGKPGLTSSQGWQLDVPSLDGWQVKHGVEKQRDYLEVRQDNAGPWIVRLPAGQRVTWWALHPPGPGRTVPLLAIALTEGGGEPALHLYRVDTGELLRHYNGHDAPIRSLAFSRDGQLLVSAAEDQTVRVWTLTDLKDHVGKHGGLPGVVVKDVPGGGVEVASTLGASPLAPGDPLTGMEVANKLEKLASARHFYDLLWELKPGSDTTVKVRGKKDVTLQVRQGIDEHPPLLSLFVTRAKAGQGDWLGWSPQGPYEASAPQVERLLGWHTATADPKRPVAYANAAKYRDRYDRSGKGLLAQIVEKAQVSYIPPPPAPPPPKVAVALGGIVLDRGQVDRGGHIPVQTARRDLWVRVDAYPLSHVADVQWSVDGGAWQRFEDHDGREWETALPETTRRGEHLLHVRIVTRDESHAPPVEKFLLRRQPPAPGLTSLPEPGRHFARGEEFPLALEIKPRPLDQRVQTEILHNGRPVAHMPGLKIPLKIALAKGKNTIRIKARNQGALPGFEDAETTQIAFEVEHNPGAPQVRLLQVEPLFDGAKGPGAPARIEPGEHVLVETPTVRVRGTIRAEEELQEASRNGTALRDFARGRRELDFTEELTLKPGPQIVTVLARTRNTQAAAEAELFYAPPLPHLQLDRPAAGLTFYDEGKGPPNVRLRYVLEPPTPPTEFTASVLINGKPAPPPSIDAAGKELTIAFTPAARESQVQVLLESPWRAAETAAVAQVRYLRPPHAVTLSAPRQSKDPVVRLTAHVESALPLEPKRIEAAVNGQPIQAVEVKPGKDHAWEVVLNNVSLDPAKGSKNEVTLRVSNADGTSSKSEAATIVYVGREPRRPVLALREQVMVTTDPHAEVRCTARCEVPLVRLTLVREWAGEVLRQAIDPGAAQDLRLALRLGAAPTPRPLEVAGLPPDAEGWRRAGSAVWLGLGINRLRLEAASAEGDAQALEWTITLQPPPIRVVVDKLVTDDGREEEIPWRAGAGFAQAAPDGKMILQGRLLWEEESDARLKNVEMVRVRVNGSLQRAGVALAAPQPKKPRERSFRTPVFLTQREKNELTLEVPQLDLSDASTLRYEIDCARPVAEERVLHLLPIGVGEPDGERLKRRIYAALEAQPRTSREFALDPFAWGSVYGPATGEVEPDQVYFEIARIQRRVSFLSGQKLYSHVVLVYYHGSEVIDSRGHYLAGGALSCASLEKRLEDILGAQILLLDVTRDKAATRPVVADSKDYVLHWPDESPVAVLRWAQDPDLPAGKASGLLKEWGKALPDSKYLADLDGTLQQRFAAIEANNKGRLHYDPHIPPTLRRLIVGRK